MAKAQPSPRAARKRAERDEPETVTTVASPDTPSEQPAQRLSFPVRPDGTIDAERLRSSSREALRKAFSDPSLPSALGIASASTNSSTSEDAAIMQQIASGLYDGVSALSIALARRAGFSIEQARVLVFTPDEKTVLAEPTARVINKYFPDFGGKYRDELMLAFLLTNIMGAKIMMLRSSVSGSTVAPSAPQSPVSEPSSPMVAESIQ